MEIYSMTGMEFVGRDGQTTYRHNEREFCFKAFDNQLDFHSVKGYLSRIGNVVS